MDTERTCLELLLRRVRYTDIELDKKEKEISYCRIHEKRFLKIAETVLDRYTGDELIQMCRWLNQRLNRGDSEEYTGGIFSCIREIAGRFLEMRDGRFLCRTYAAEEETPYSLQLLRWRELSVSLGNEIFMASLLAKNGVGTSPLKDWLCTPFPPFDGRIRQAAAMEHMAGNHFHLKGSIPVFTLNWVCLMNHIGDTNKAFFLNFDRYLEPEFIYEEEQPKHSRLIESCRQAAFYRMYLCHRLHRNNAFLDSAIFHTMNWEEEKLGELQLQINVCRSEHEKIAGPDGDMECLDYAAGEAWKEIAGEDELDYFYVLHYPKRKDTAFQELKPRNYRIRDYLDRQISEETELMKKELSVFRYHGKIPKVRGFDTCSGEIGCRPEVFGEFYRRPQAYNRQAEAEQAHFTCHVGEDFLDIFSGLRAVDEAVRFCRLPRGSRIGHGMVLGIDAKRYYQLKKNSAVLDKQEILDNTAWILGFCQEHGIGIDSDLYEELQRWFSKYLGEIYGCPPPPGAAGRDPGGPAPGSGGGGRAHT